MTTEVKNPRVPYDQGTQKNKSGLSSWNQSDRTQHDRVYPSIAHLFIRIPYCRSLQIHLLAQVRTANKYAGTVHECVKKSLCRYPWRALQLLVDLILALQPMLSRVVSRFETFDPLLLMARSVRSENWKCGSLIGAFCKSGNTEQNLDTNWLWT